MKNIKKIEQVAGITLVAGIVIGCWLVLRPFMSSILWAAILCSATWPLHELLLRWFHGRRTLAAGLMTLLLSLAILIPFVVVAFTFTESIQSALKWLESQSSTTLPRPPDWVARIPWVGSRIHEDWVRLVEESKQPIEWLTPWLRDGGKWLLGRSLDVATGVVHLTMSVLIAFFLYRDGPGVVRHLRAGFRQIGGDTASRLLDVVKVTVRSVVYGVIGTALAQGLLAGVGFRLANIPATELLALFTFFLSFIPFGPPIVWIGACAWLFSHGRIQWGIFLSIYGLLVITTVDNVIKPYIISRGSRLSFIVMFIGVLGGVVAFGFIGVFLGPTLLAVGVALTQEILDPQRFTLGSDPPENPTPAAEEP